MDARRVADLHRELARVHAELAEAMDVSAEAPTERPSQARPRAPAKPRLVRPEGENDELAKRKAQTFLRRNGYTKANR